MKSEAKHPLRNRPGLFVLFLVISLLLHLVTGLLLRHIPIVPVITPKPVETPVALQERKSWLELDQKPVKKEVQPPDNAQHIAEANQKVEKETSRKGDDSRDQQRAMQTPQQRQQQANQPITKPRQQPVTEAFTPKTPAFPSDQSGTQAPAAETDSQPQKLPVELPKLSVLTNLAPNTQARLDNQQLKDRSKDRPEIELKSDEVWLNLRQDDKLISFFRRFSDRIEAVWNYPVEASSRGIEGTLLIKIVVNKKGELIDALPLESSGSEILDYEAIQAIYRAAPFGPLPSYYPHEQLKIYAHFQYSISRRAIYGRP